MKKLIPLLLMVSACSLSYAESMKFITVLSSPVGTFNKLEAVDPAQQAKGNTVNFCTNIGTQGVVELKGTKTADLNIVSLAKNTTLGKTDEGKFSLNNITLKQGGNIKGGRLFGNTLKVDYQASGKANNLYGNTLTVAGAKTNDLTVTNASYIKKGEQNSAVINNPPDMVWSNQYQSDDACKEGASYEKCKQQYLLKSRGVSGSEEDSGSKCTHCTAYEKGSSEYTNCVKNSVINIDRQCCREAQVFFSTQTEQEKTKCWKIQQSNTDYYESEWEELSRSELTWRFSKASLNDVNSSSFSCLGGRGSEDWTECTGSDFCAQGDCALSCMVQCSPFGHKTEYGISTTSTWQCRTTRVTPACVGFWVNE